MIANTTSSTASTMGLRTLELGMGLLWLRKQLINKLGPGAHSISLSGARTSKEQELLGISQILLVMFPFAIELAIKSLWDCFHEHGTYDRRHDLHILFQSLHKNAMDVDAAVQAQKQARDLWLEFQSDKKIHHSGTLDDFLTVHAKDFVETRYYKLKPPEFLQIDDFALCFYCIIYPLAAHDNGTLLNLISVHTA
ncbi:MAG: hypothetical protein OXI37_04900 [Gammaproteobacteria bacterium]|nr:hypothetical protein [Gammaproteobacteria bacterium]